MFTPKFNNRVFIESSLEGVNPVQVNPALCLSPASADQLAEILTSEGGCSVTQFDASPVGPMHGPFGVSTSVPWFKVQYPGATPDVLRTITANFNAGPLAMWWHSSPDPKTALRYCLLEINAGLADAFANQA